jgi:hypothetical protein
MANRHASVLNPVANSDPDQIGLPATKGSIEDGPSRRAILAVIGSAAVTGLAPWTVAFALAEDLVVRDGWVLRSSDLARLGLA